MKIELVGGPEYTELKAALERALNSHGDGDAEAAWLAVPMALGASGGKTRFDVASRLCQRVKNDDPFEGVIFLTFDEPSAWSASAGPGRPVPELDLVGQISLFCGVEPERPDSPPASCYLKVPCELGALREHIHAASDAGNAELTKRRVEAAAEVVSWCKDRRTSEGHAEQEIACELVRYDGRHVNMNRLMALEHRLVSAGKESHAKQSEELSKLQVYSDYAGLLTYLQEDSDHGFRNHLIIEDRPEGIAHELDRLGTLTGDTFWITKDADVALTVADAILTGGGEDIAVGDLGGWYEDKPFGHVGPETDPHPAGIEGFDVVWVDLLLHKNDTNERVDGLKVLREVREHYPAVLCGVLSWSEDLSRMDEARRKNADIYLPKRRIVRMPAEVSSTFGRVWPGLEHMLDPERGRLLAQSIRRWRHEPGILWHGEKTFHAVDHSLCHHNHLWNMARDLVGKYWQALKPRFDTLAREGGSGCGASDYLLYLLMAIWLHDIGLKGDGTAASPPEVRELHGLIAGRLLKQAYPRPAHGEEGGTSGSADHASHSGSLQMFGLEPREVDPVALLCTFHQSSSPITESKALELLMAGRVTQVQAYSEFMAKVMGVEGVPVLQKARPDLVPLAFLLRLIDGMDYCWDRVGSEVNRISRKTSIDNDAAYFSQRDDPLDKAYAKWLGGQEEHMRKHRGVLDEGLYAREAPDGIIEFWPWYLLSQNWKDRKTALSEIPKDVWKEWVPAKDTLIDALKLTLGRSAPDVTGTGTHGERLYVGETRCWFVTPGKNAIPYDPDKVLEEVLGASKRS